MTWYGIVLVIAGVVFFGWLLEPRAGSTQKKPKPRVIQPEPPHICGPDCTMSHARPRYDFTHRGIQHNKYYRRRRDRH